MSIREGARRIRMAGWCLMLMLPLVFGAPYFFLFGPRAIAMCLVAVIPGAVLWLAGWIVDGFAKEGLKNNSLEH
jgi:NADH:ubiquinone oxidoreductase subunit 6 (subunit J)